MLEKLLNLFIKATNLQPDYTKEHCIAYRQTSTACKRCQETCPHEAISFKRNREVVIDEVDCTGCGLCVQTCPSQALSARTSLQSGAPLKCSQVKGGAQTVQCLTRLTPPDLLRLAGSQETITLVRGACANCKIGDATVPDKLQETFERAKALADFRGRPLRLELLEKTHYDATDSPYTVSRRDLLRGSWRGLAQTAADVLAPLAAEEDSASTLPVTMQREYTVIKNANPEPDTPVPWVLPRVAEGCIMCPVCTNVCPTKAFRRDFHPVGKSGTVLLLEPERCNGCGACVSACPVHVITLDHQVSWGELSGGAQTAYYKDPKQANAGAIARGSTPSETITDKSA
jgi:ferredoxin